MDCNAHHRFSTMVFAGNFSHFRRRNRLSCTAAVSGSLYDLSLIHISYNPDEIESNATKLNLYISHRVEDGEESVTRSNFTYAYRALSLIHIFFLNSSSSKKSTSTGSRSTL